MRKTTYPRLMPILPRWFHQGGASTPTTPNAMGSANIGVYDKSDTSPTPGVAWRGGAPQDHDASRAYDPADRKPEPQAATARQRIAECRARRARGSKRVRNADRAP